MSMQPATLQRVSQAWAELADVPCLMPLQVIVRAQSLLHRPGWVGIVCIADQLTVAVPTSELVEPVSAALAGLSGPQVSAQALLERVPAAREVLGPASLFYSLEASLEEPDQQVCTVAREELASLRAGLSEEDWAESGLDYVQSEAFVVIKGHDGQIVAACGYERWPAGIAQLCIATLPESRRRGAGRQVARAALARAHAEGLLPQWRAAPEPSRALARALGLHEVGFQLGLRWPHD